MWEHGNMSDRHTLISCHWPLSSSVQSTNAKTITHQLSAKNTHTNKQKKNHRPTQTYAYLIQTNKRGTANVALLEVLHTLDCSVHTVHHYVVQCTTSSADGNIILLIDCSKVTLRERRGRREGGEGMERERENSVPNILTPTSTS